MGSLFLFGRKSLHWSVWPSVVLCLIGGYLLTNFYGTPFVDLRVDFNSWIPAKLDKKISEKLVNYYLDEYKKNPELHDKIEFNIIFTCFAFDTNEKLKRLLKFGFSKKEIKSYI